MNENKATSGDARSGATSERASARHLAAATLGPGYAWLAPWLGTLGGWLTGRESRLMRGLGPVLLAALALITLLAWWFGR